MDALGLALFATLVDNTSVVQRTYINFQMTTDNSGKVTDSVILPNDASSVTILLCIGQTFNVGGDTSTTCIGLMPNNTLVQAGVINRANISTSTYTLASLYVRMSSSNKVDIVPRLDRYSSSSSESAPTSVTTNFTLYIIAFT